MGKKVYPIRIDGTTYKVTVSSGVANLVTDIQANVVGASTEANGTFASVAKYTFQDDLDVDGVLVVGGGITNTGDIQTSNDMIVGSDVVVANDVDISGGCSVSGNIILSSSGIYHGSGSPEGVVAANIGSLYLDSAGGSGTSLYTKESGSGTTGWVNVAGTSSQVLSQSWAMVTQSSGNTYIGGFLIDAGSDNDFNPSVNFGTANKAYAAHIYFVAAAGATDTEITVSGTSVSDSGGLHTGDSETVALNSGSANFMVETTKKWVGQVSIVKSKGTDRLCNYGFAKYWDNGNTDFTIVGGEALWQAGKTDTSFDILVYKYSATGWTYHAGASAAPPAPLFQLSDVSTGLGAYHETLVNTPGTWKRTGLSTFVAGSLSEGVIIKVITGTTNVIDNGTITLNFTSG